MIVSRPSAPAMTPARAEFAFRTPLTGPHGLVFDFFPELGAAGVYLGEHAAHTVVAVELDSRGLVVGDAEFPDPRVPLATARDALSDLVHRGGRWLPVWAATAGLLVEAVDNRIAGRMWQLATPSGDVLGHYWTRAAADRTAALGDGRTLAPHGATIELIQVPGRRAVAA